MVFTFQGSGKGLKFGETLNMTHWFTVGITRELILPIVDNRFLSVYAPQWSLNSPGVCTSNGTIKSSLTKQPEFKNLASLFF